MMDNVYLASVYRLMAVDFRMSAETLFANMETRDDGTPAHAKPTAIPFYFLISHAAELFLKSALLKRGFAQDDLKKYDYRHNLNALLGELQNKGVSVTPDTVNLIGVLHQQHQTHTLRYTAILSDGQPIYMPPPSLLFNMLNELLSLTRIATQGV